MATADPQSNASNGQAQFDANKALKNYAAGMGMPSLYWPSGFDNTMYAAYSQASALAAAAVANGQLTVATQPQTPSGGSTVTNGTPPISLPYRTTVSPSTTSLSGTLALPAHSTTPTTPKKKPEPVPDHLKDGQYWERRKRNNESARRSRESRRVKEEQIALRVVYLEQENLQLRTEVSMLRSEIEKLRMILYNAHH